MFIYSSSYWKTPKSGCCWNTTSFPSWKCCVCLFHVCRLKTWSIFSRSLVSSTRDDLELNSPLIQIESLKKRRIDLTYTSTAVMISGNTSFKRCLIGNAIDYAVAWLFWCIYVYMNLGDDMCLSRMSWKSFIAPRRKQNCNRVIVELFVPNKIIKIFSVLIKL